MGHSSAAVGQFHPDFLLFIADVKATAAHGKVIVRAWRDPAFKARLITDPHAMLKEAGFAVLEGVTVKVVENTDLITTWCCRPSRPHKDCDAKR